MTATGRAVIFDLDGTLVDTSGDLLYSANHLRRRASLPPLTVEEVLVHVGWGADYLVGMLLGLDEDDEAGRKDALITFRTHYAEHQTERSAPYPGIVDALTRLARSADLYILSNKPHPAVVAEVALQNLRPHFREVWGYDALGAPKPDPRGIYKALEISGADPHRAVMVGDMRPDIAAGLRAGVQTAWVSWGFGRRDESWPEPTFVAESAEALAREIEQRLL